MNYEDSEERSTGEFEFVDDVYAHLPVAHHMARTEVRCSVLRVVGGLRLEASQSG